MQLMDAAYQKRTIVQSRGRMAAQRAMWQWVVFGALAPALSDIALVRVSGFVVTLPHLVLFCGALFSLIVWGRVGRFPTLVCLTIGLVEIVHAVSLGFIVAPEWYRSFAQYVVYAGCFLLLSGFKPTWRALEGTTTWVLWLALFWSGVGILQFALMSIGVRALIPTAIRASGYDPLSETRAGGLAPAVGMATEPSRYALALVTLLALVLVLGNLGIVRRRTLWGLTILALLGATLVTFSLTGIILALCVGLTEVLLTRRGRRSLVVFLLALPILLLLSDGALAPTWDRLGRAMRGDDNSASIRVVASMRLLLSPLDDPGASWFGTGMGMQAREHSAYERIYAQVRGAPSASDTIRIHNILAAIRLLQGWFGVALYSVLAIGIVGPLAQRYRVYAPLCVLFALYHFATGHYLTPQFWSLLALLVIVAKVGLQVPEGARGIEPHRSDASSFC